MVGHSSFMILILLWWRELLRLFVVCVCVCVYDLRGRRFDDGLGVGSGSGSSVDGHDAAFLTNTKDRM